mgnify:FL=1
MSEERIRTCKENIPSGARKISSNVLKERNSNEVKFKGWEILILIGHVS